MAKSKRKRHGLKSSVGEDPGPDISLLSRPSATSVKGIRDVLKAFEEGTAEVNHLLSNECELVYECRVCRSLYRSFLNFITHKRIYCQQQYTSGSPKASHFFNDTLDEDETLVVQDEPVRITRQTNNSANTNPDAGITTSNSHTVPKPKPVPRKNLTEILGLLSQKASNSNNEGLKRIVNLDGYTEMVASSNSGATAAGFKGRTPRQHLLHLESLECTDVARRQTVTLGPDGKILPPDKVCPIDEDDGGETRASSPQVDNNQNDVDVDLVCTKCTPHATFSSRKTFRHHLNSQHDPSRISFVCPCCKRHFANSWSVHRHLKTVHGKSTEQLRKLRDQIQTVKREPVQEEPPKPAKLKVEDGVKEKLERDSTKQTELELFERELQKCSGCDKKFDRLAAFNYHVRSCQKRHTVLKSKTTRKGALTIKSSSSRRSAPPMKIAVEKTEVLAESPASDSDSTIDPGVDETCAAPLPAGFEPRELRNNNVRTEQVVAKKIEIQLRRDYNKIATPVSSDIQASTSTLDDAAGNNQESVRPRVDSTPRQDTPAQHLLEPLGGNAEQELSEEEDMSCDEDSEPESEASLKQSQTDSNSIDTSSNDDQSEIYELDIEHKEEEGNNASTVSISSSSSDVASEHVANESNEQSSSEASETMLSDSVIEVSGSMSVVLADEELLADDYCNPDREILLYHGLREIRKCSEASESNSPQKSILEEILTKDKEVTSITTASASPTPASVTMNAAEDEITVILDQRRKPFKKRTSVTAWNGFVAGPKKKRFRGISKPLTNLVTILPHNGSEAEEDTSAVHVQEKGLARLPNKPVFTEPANVEVITLHEPDDCKATDEDLEEPTEDLEEFQEREVPSPNNCDQVLVKTPDDELTRTELDDSDDKIEEDTPRNSKVDVDTEILKVIFTEEDISHTSNESHKKGTITFGNGLFQLHSAIADKSEPRAAPPENLPSQVDDLLPRASSSSEEEEQSSFTSLSDVEQMRSSSAMDSDVRSFTPVTREPRSSSAMETESGALNAESESRYLAEALQSTSSRDLEQGKSSGLGTETHSSWMESVLARTRPVRNKAKAKNSDFIYDLSDKAVYDEERCPVRSKSATKTSLKPQVSDISPTQEQKEGPGTPNPHVMLIRAEDVNRLSLGYLKHGSVVKPVAGSSKGSLPGFAGSAATRKSVRVVTKI